MKTIQLTQGYFATVDDSDFELVNQYKWHVYKKKRSTVLYAYRNIPNGKGGQTSIQMHRVILGITDKNIMVDHADGNGLNNQRSNIRIATSSQNAANRKPFGKSQYRGVSLIVTKYGEYWYAKCSKGKNVKHKLCDTEEEAAMVYNRFAKSIHGQFARLNVVANA